MKIISRALGYILGNISLCTHRCFMLCLILLLASSNTLGYESAQNSTRIVVTVPDTEQATKALNLLANITWGMARQAGNELIIIDLARPAQLPDDVALFEGLFYANNLTIINCEIDILVSSVVVQMLPYNAGDGWQYVDKEPYSLQMETVWHNYSQVGEKSVVVAVLDTGLAQVAMDSLFENLADGYSFASDDEWGPSVLDPGAVLSEACPAPFHGTMMGSVIAGKPDLVPGILSMQPNITLLPVKVLNECGQGYANDVANAILWAVGANLSTVGVPVNPTPAKVLSMSFVGKGECPTFLQNVINIAVLRYGAILVVSAGNDANNVSNFFPANCIGVIPVAATTRAGSLSSYSNFGPAVRTSAPGGDWPDPVYSATVTVDPVSGLQELDVGAAYGSSFSAAFVSGMFALKYSMNLPISPLFPFILEEMNPFPRTSILYTFLCGGGIESGLRLIQSNKTLDISKKLFEQNLTMLNNNSGDYELLVIAATTCPAGTYQTSTTTSVCISCFAGYFTTGTGLPSCPSCVAGTFSSSNGASVCTNCSSGSYSKPGGPTTCSTCPLGTYASSAASVWCSLCAAGSYSNTTNSTACFLCGAGTFSSGLGLTSSTNCSACTSGTYSSQTGASQLCTLPKTTWLYKSPITAYYYLNLPSQNAATWNNAYYTYWNKVRINTTLSNSITTVLLYVMGKNLTWEAQTCTAASLTTYCPTGSNGGICNSNSCLCPVVQYQYDITYAILPSPTSYFVDYGGYTSCNSVATSNTINITGTPFSILNGVNSWLMPGCSWFGACCAVPVTYTCINAQVCTVSGEGNCAIPYFMGWLGVLNTTAFQNDVNVSCKLYPYDSLLSCTGQEVVNYTCAPVPCSACPIGTYSSANGSSACLNCPAGMYGTAIGASSCSLCSAGTYSSVGWTTCNTCTNGSSSLVGASICLVNASYYDLGLSLMAYYPFNPNQMTIDVSGNLGVLTIPVVSPTADCGTAALGPGGNWASNCVSAMQANSAISSASASAQYLGIPNIVLPLNYSICLWYEPTPYSSSSPNSYEYLFGISQSSSMNYAILVQRIGTSNGMGCLIDNTYASWTVNWQPGLYFSPNTWYHICFTFSGTAYNFFVNGVSAVSGSLSASQSTSQAR